MEDRWLGTITPNNLSRMHDPIVIAARPADDIGQPWVRVDKGRFDLKGSFVIHSMTMNYMSNLEAGKTYLSNALYLVVGIITL